MWTSNGQASTTQAVTTLKEKLVNYGTLQVPDLGTPYARNSNASAYAAEAVVEQERSSISYFSKKKTTVSRVSRI